MANGTLVHEEWFPVTPDRLFALLHTPGAIRQWWGASRAIVVPEVGGVWTAAWGAVEDDPDCLTMARVEVFEPPRLLRLVNYQSRCRDGTTSGSGGVVTEFAIRPDSGGAMLRLTQEGLSADEEREGVFATCGRNWRDTFTAIRYYLDSAGRPPAAATAPLADRSAAR